MIFKINNGMTLKLTQTKTDGDVLISHQDGDSTDAQYKIPAGEFVMLLNYYRYIKREDIQEDFINPGGLRLTKKEKRKYYGN